MLRSEGLIFAHVGVVLSKYICFLFLGPDHVGLLGLLVHILVPLLAHDRVRLFLSLPPFGVRRRRLEGRHRIRAVAVSARGIRKIACRPLLQPIVQILLLFFVWGRKSFGETLPQVGEDLLALELLGRRLD